MRRFLLLISLCLTLCFGVQSQESKEYFQEATRFVEKNDFEKALSFYQKALKSLENKGDNAGFSANIYYNIGVCFYQLNAHEKAVSAFSQAIKLKPDYQKAFYGIGMANFALSEWKEAESAFLKALELNPQNGEVWFDLAIVFLVKKNHQKALQAFQNSIENKSRDADLSQNNIGVILAETGNFDSAEKSFEKAWELSHHTLKEAQENLKLCKNLQKTKNYKMLVAFKLSLRSNSV